MSVIDAINTCGKQVKTKPYSYRKMYRMILQVVMSEGMEKTLEQVDDITTAIETLENGLRMMKLSLHTKK